MPTHVVADAPMVADQDDRRKVEDLARRQELSRVLLQGTIAMFEASADDGEVMEFDLSLTTPVEHTDGDDDMEMLFENEPVGWDWSLTQATGLFSAPKDDLETLFEPEAKGEGSQDMVTRSQPAVGLAADHGQPAAGMAWSVGRAAALTPVTSRGNFDEEEGGASSSTLSTHEVAARIDKFRPAARARGRAEAQVPGHSEVLTPQQLNSKKQNLRRAKLKAAEKVTTGGKRTAAVVAEGGRLFDSVAAFWERKKAKSAAVD